VAGVVKGCGVAEMMMIRDKAVLHLTSLQLSDDVSIIEFVKFVTGNKTKQLSFRDHYKKLRKAFVSVV